MSSSDSQQAELIVSNLAELKQEMSAIHEAVAVAVAKLQGFERREDLNRRLGDRLLSLTQTMNGLVAALDRLNLPLTRAQNSISDMKADFDEWRHEQRHELQKRAEKIAEVRTLAATIQGEVSAISSKVSVVSKDLDDATGSFKVQQPTTKERIAAIGFGALAKMPSTVQIVVAVGIALAVVGGVWGWVYGLVHR